MRRSFPAEPSVLRRLSVPDRPSRAPSRRGRPSSLPRMKRRACVGCGRSSDDPIRRANSAHRHCNDIVMDLKRVQRRQSGRIPARASRTGASSRAAEWLVPWRRAKPARLPMTADPSDSSRPARPAASGANKPSSSRCPDARSVPAPCVRQGRCRIRWHRPSRSTTT